MTLKPGFHLRTPAITAFMEGPELPDWRKEITKTWGAINFHRTCISVLVAEDAAGEGGCPVHYITLHRSVHETWSGLLSVIFHAVSRKGVRLGVGKALIKESVYKQAILGWLKLRSYWQNKQTNEAATTN